MNAQKLREACIEASLDVMHLGQLARTDAVIRTVLEAVAETIQDRFAVGPLDERATVWNEAVGLAVDDVRSLMSKDPPAPLEGK